MLNAPLKKHNGAKALTNVLFFLQPTKLFSKRQALSVRVTVIGKVRQKYRKFYEKFSYLMVYVKFFIQVGLVICELTLDKSLNYRVIPFSLSLAKRSVKVVRDS